MSSQLPNGLIPFGPDANCTLELCPLEASILRYRPSQPANATFTGIFGLAIMLHAAQGFRYGTWGFSLSIVCGGALEIAGYVARLMLYDNPFDFGSFLVQIILITIAPVFFCAAIYVLLSQIVDFADRSISRFDPRLYYWVFIPCDIISLVLQAVGGALSCTAENQADVQVGVDISLAGLVFQIATLLLFCGLLVDYVLLWSLSPAWNVMTKRLRIFLFSFSVAILLILLRCVYRVVELHDGYFSKWFRHEELFIGLESTIMCVAIFCLLGSNPKIALSDRAPEKAYEGENYLELRSQRRISTIDSTAPGSATH